MRVSTKALQHYPWLLKPFFWSQRRRYGEVLLPGLLWARVLDYTEAVTHSDRQVDDAMVAALKAWFDEDGIVELTGLIAFQNLSSKFNAALDVPAQGFCQRPKQIENR